MAQVSACGGGVFVSVCRLFFSGYFGLHFLNVFQVVEAFLFRLFGLELTQGGPDPPLFPGSIPTTELVVPEGGVRIT